MSRRERLFWSIATSSGVVGIVLILTLRWNRVIDDGVAVPLVLASTLLTAGSAVATGVRVTRSRRRDGGEW